MHADDCFAFRSFMGLLTALRYVVFYFNTHTYLERVSSYSFRRIYSDYFARSVLSPLCWKSLCIAVADPGRKIFFFIDSVIQYICVNMAVRELGKSFAAGTAFDTRMVMRSNARRGGWVGWAPISERLFPSRPWQSPASELLVDGGGGGKFCQPRSRTSEKFNGYVHAVAAAGRFILT